MTSFSQTLEETLQRSIDYASQKKHEHVTIEHLLLSLTDDKDAQKVFIACDLDINILKNDLTKYIRNYLYQKIKISIISYSNDVQVCYPENIHELGLLLNTNLQ